MRLAKILTLVGFFLTISTVVVFRAVNAPQTPDKLLSRPDMGFAREELQALARDQIAVQREAIALEKARLQEKQDALPTWRYIKYGGAVWLLVSMGGAALILATAYRRKLLTHILRIGPNEIPVRDADLKRIAPEVSMGLAVAEQTKAERPEMSAELLKLLVPVIVQQLRATHARALTEMIPQAALPPAPVHVPTFGELVQRGEIAPGKPLIFGFTNDGGIRTGGWVDLFSNATGGASGSGKTSTLRGLIGQSVLQGVRFWVHDEHYPHPESLLASLGPLADLDAVQHCGNMPLETIMADVEETIAARMSGEESDAIPRVFVVDEVLQAVERVPALSKTIKRIGIAGRKVKVYGLFAAQTWLAKETGGSGVRDNLTSRIVHSMKKKQAQTLLQDADLAKMCPDLQPGQMLFSPVNGATEVLRVPFCTANDMREVYRMVGNGGMVKDIDAFFESVSRSTQTVDLETAQVNVDHRVDLDVDPTDRDVDLFDRVNAYLEKPGKSLRGLAESTGIDKGYLSKMLSGKKPLSDKAREKLETTIEETNVIDLTVQRAARKNR